MKTKYKKYGKCINVCLILVLIFFTSIESADAADWWKQAGTWYDSLSGNGAPSGAKDIIGEFENIINILGTTIIAAATVFLGVKYMFASVEGKAEVKESLITLLIACVFFFGWQAIATVLIKGGKLVFVDNTSMNTTIGNIFSTVMLVANVLMIAAVIYVGVRYIFSGASGKADLKGKSGQFVIGIILSFCAVSFLTMISNVVNEIF